VSACTIDPGAPTGATVILSSGRDRAMLTAMGTIGSLDVDAIPSSLVRRARHLHLGSYFAQTTSRARLPSFYAAAREHGLTTSFDTNWDPDDRWDGGVRDMLAVTDLFFPNAMEARRIAGVEAVEDAARSLASAGSAGRTDGGPLVLVKLGAAGALACSPDGEVIRVPSLTVEPLDTTGAGDAFDSGFVRAWLDGASIREALEFGVACGALSTRAAGGVDGQPSLDEARRAVAEGMAG
jgi:sugar/nucleoside kinase (ribokinase family)